MPLPILILLLLLSMPMSSSSSSSSSLSWSPRSSFDASSSEYLGRHHPITFANETHGFILGGSAMNLGVVPDLHIYDEIADSWFDGSDALANSEYISRTYGYGVTLDETNHRHAYVGFGSDEYGNRMSDWWEFDMTTLSFRKLASFPGEGRHHPSMVSVYVDESDDDDDDGGDGGGSGGGWQIHVGLGDGLVGENLDFVNFDDYYSYSIQLDTWTKLSDFPGGRRHHPYYFSLGRSSYVGFGHGDVSPYVYRDVYRYDAVYGTWNGEDDFASYDDVTGEVVTTEGRVAGTQFSITLPPTRGGGGSGSAGGDEAELYGSIGFVLSGDGDDHSYMPNGEFHAYSPDDGRWTALPSHPGSSRWAPGSFVMRGTARAYFMCGYDRSTNALRSDVWGIDLSSLFAVDSSSMTTASETSATTSATETSITTTTTTDASMTTSVIDAAADAEETTDDVHDEGVDVVAYDVACATRDECDERRTGMKIAEFRAGEYPSYGCFVKNGIAYWGEGGSIEGMSIVELPGERERIWCAGGRGEGGGVSSSSSSSAIIEDAPVLASSSSTRVVLRVATWIIGASAIAICSNPVQ